MPNFQSVFFGVSEQNYDKRGTRPSFAINRPNQGVEIHSENGALFFRVAAVSGLTIEYADPKPASFANGHNPTVALTRSGVVVEAHDLSGKIYYSVRELAGSVVQTAAVRELPNPLANSSDPSISINADGVVILLFKSGSDLYWRRGSLHLMNLMWAASSHLLVADGTTPSVSLNDNGLAIAVYENSDDLYYLTGRYVPPDGSTGATIMWRSPSTPRERYDQGVDPSVVLTANNAVFEVHKSETADNLFQRIGVLSSDGNTITWQAFFGGTERSRKYDTGLSPRIAANAGVAVEVHETESTDDKKKGDLYTNASLIFDRGNWMNDNFGRLKSTPLKKTGAACVTRRRSVRPRCLAANADASDFRTAHGRPALLRYPAAQKHRWGDSRPSCRRRGP